MQGFLKFNPSEMQAPKIFVVTLLLYRCDWLHFRGRQAPDVLDLFYWVRLCHAKSAHSAIMCQFSKEGFSGKF